MLRNLSIRASLLVTLAVPLLLLLLAVLALVMVSGSGATGLQIPLAVGGLAVLVVGAIVSVATARHALTRLDDLASTTGRLRDELPGLLSGDGTLSITGAAGADGADRNDEVGTLETVLGDLGTTTAQIVHEQAALRVGISETIVTVARRDQTLLSRQLNLLDNLERTEQDPDALERLFALDHLATRMRRNAESLLVLAGAPSGRQLRAPLPLSDVVRTAAGEIESYQRVDLAGGSDKEVLGYLALPAAHLVAELLDNATRFSDPDKRVVVRTTETARGVELSIADGGFGMSEEDIATAGYRILAGGAGGEEFVGCQCLGFFVVGRLAARLDIEIEFAAAEGDGTTVTLVLPATLFVPVEDDEAPAITPAADEFAEHSLPALPSVDEPEFSSAVPVEEDVVEKDVEEAGELVGAHTIVTPDLTKFSWGGEDGEDGEDIAYVPIAVAEDAASEMPHRAPQVLPTTLGAAEDILPKAGRHRASRRHPAQRRGVASAFWGARRGGRYAASTPVVPPVFAPEVQPGATPLVARRTAPTADPAPVVARRVEDDLAARVAAETGVEPRVVDASGWHGSPLATGPANPSVPEFPKFPKFPEFPEFPGTGATVDVPVGTVPADLRGTPAETPAEIPAGVSVETRAEIPAEIPAEDAVEAATATAPDPDVEPVVAPENPPLDPPLARRAPPDDRPTQYVPEVVAGGVQLARRSARTPVEAPVPATRSVPESRQRRAPADVRSMLSGFQAGVDRARTRPDADPSTDDAAGSPAPETPAAETGVSAEDRPVRLKPASRRRANPASGAGPAPSGSDKNA